MLVERKVRSDAKIYEYDGKAMTLVEWARYLDVSTSCLRKRMAAGLEGADLFCGNKLVKVEVIRIGEATFPRRGGS